MMKTHAPKGGHADRGPTLTCPECGAAIPVADAVEQAVTTRTRRAEETLARLQNQEARLHLESETRVRELEQRLSREHAAQLARIETERSRDEARFMQSINQMMALRVKETDDLRKAVDSARAEGMQRFEAGRTESASLMKTLKADLDKAKGEQSRLSETLRTTESKLAAGQFEANAAFERGRSSALESAQKELKDLHRLLDGLRDQSLAREKDLDRRVAEAVREAETRVARTQKAALAQKVEEERLRLSREITQSQAEVHAVERQRLETQMQRMQEQIATLHRKAESTSQEALGEASEEVLERDLRDAFQADGDLIQRMKKGQAGADFLITVAGAGGQKVLVERKWTQSFEKAWIGKAREDRAKAGAETVVIVTRTLPSGVAHLTQMEDVWITGPSTALALISSLRQGMVAVERATRAFNMDEARIAALKGYLSGPQFRQQVEQIVSLAAELDKGLTRERTQHERAWKEAHAAFERILSAAIGLWTDLEIHSGQGLVPSDVLKPFLTPEARPAQKKRSRAA